MIDSGGRTVFMESLPVVVCVENDHLNTKNIGDHINVVADLLSLA